MIKRLKMLIKALSLTERAFALKCGIAQNTMSYYLSEKRKPSYEAIEKILNTFQEVSADWLTRGKGDMFLSQCDNQLNQSERMNKLVDTIALLQDTINSKNETIKTLTEQINQLQKLQS